MSRIAKRAAQYLFTDWKDELRFEPIGKIDHEPSERSVGIMYEYCTFENKDDHETYTVCSDGEIHDEDGNPIGTGYYSLFKKCTEIAASQSQEAQKEWLKKYPRHDPQVLLNL
jgi:hypothetical protein